MSTDETIREATNRIVATVTAMFDSEMSGDEELVDPLLDELPQLSRAQIEGTCLAAFEMIKSLLEVWADVDLQRDLGRPATQVEKSQWALARIREQAEGIASELEGLDDRGPES